MGAKPHSRAAELSRNSIWNFRVDFSAEAEPKPLHYCWEKKYEVLFILCSGTQTTTFGHSVIMNDDEAPGTETKPHA